ncbi:hypothetical protein J5277_29355 [Rhizobium sp. 16-449-1b]|uniref:hypothetical protein n=1 Tax=Rhizobium sp. 16-449-1b TaxID=2819989 RepID=UPI001ADA96E4|nr:hypothetical protein [Rhizobium sp. 16-449-1b]MBO9198242.1 hypothetical protein [Rhizobium sp. 16-449-1b]
MTLDIEALRIAAARCAAAHDAYMASNDENEEPGLLHELEAADAELEAFGEVAPIILELIQRIDRK